MSADADPAVRFDPEKHLPEAVGRQRRHHAHEFGGGEIGAEADETGIERDEFAFRAGRASEQGPGEAGQVVDFDDDFGDLGIADGDRESFAGEVDTGISRHRLAPRQPEFAILDGNGAGLDRLGECRKTSRQAGFQPLNIFSRTGRQIEPPGEAGTGALPQGQGDQFLLGGTIGKAVIDRDRAVLQRPLEGHHGSGAKAAERRHAIRLIYAALPRGTERLRCCRRQCGARRGERIERREGGCDRMVGRHRQLRRAHRL